MSKTRTYSDNGVPVEITLSPADIHIRPTMEERLARSYAEYDALLARHVREVTRLGRMCETLWLCIILLICAGAWLGYTAGKWEQRAVEAGWTAEVGR